ncbi:MAG: hypothetical protein QXI65_06040 [Metallosphaera sp.]
MEPLIKLLGYLVPAYSRLSLALALLFYAGLLILAISTVLASCIRS